MKKQKNSFKFGFKISHKDSSFEISELEFSWNHEDEESNDDFRNQLFDDSNQYYIEEDSND